MAPLLSVLFEGKRNMDWGRERPDVGPGDGRGGDWIGGSGVGAGDMDGWGEGARRLGEILGLPLTDRIDGVLPGGISEVGRGLGLTPGLSNEGLDGLLTSFVGFPPQRSTNSCTELCLALCFMRALGFGLLVKLPRSSGPSSSALDEDSRSLVFFRSFAVGRDTGIGSWLCFVATTGLQFSVRGSLR